MCCCWQPRLTFIQLAKDIVCRARPSTWVDASAGFGMIGTWLVPSVPRVGWVVVVVVVVVVCFTVLGGTARAHRTPAQNGQDFLVPTLKRAHR